MSSIRHFHFKKRWLIIGGIVLAILIVPLISLMFYAQSMVDDAVAAQFQIGEESGRRYIVGSGVNRRREFNENLINNESFEPLTYRRHLTVSSGNKRELKIAVTDEVADIPYPEGFFNGAKAQIMTREAYGDILKKETRVESYVGYELDEFHDLSMPNDLPDDIEWTDFAENGTVFVAVGSDGYLLTSQSYSEVRLRRIDTQQTLTGVCAWNDGFLAVDRSGKVFVSEDGNTWKHTNRRMPILPNQTVTGVDSRRDAAGNSRALIVGEKGLLVLIEPDQVTTVPVDPELSFRDVDAGKDGFYVCGDHNSLLYTDGTTVEMLSSGAEGDESWQAIDVRGENIVIAGKNGRLAYGLVGGIFYELPVTGLREISLGFTDRNLREDDDIRTTQITPSLVDCAILTDQRILLTDSRGIVYFTEDQGQVWRALSNDNAWRRHHIVRMPSGMLISANRAGMISYALTGMRFTMEEPLETGEYRAGDRLILEKLHARPLISEQFPQTAADARLSDAGEWFVNDPEAIVPTLDQAAPGAGLGALQVSLDTIRPQNRLTGIYTGDTVGLDESYDGYDAMICQRLDERAKLTLSRYQVFRLEYRAKYDGSDRLTAEVGVSGVPITVEPSSKTLKPEWQTYTDTMIIPNQTLHLDTDVWFTVKLSGKGTVYLDQIRLIPLDVNDEESDAANCGIYRLDYIPLGVSGKPSEYWLADYSVTAYETDGERLALEPRHSLLRALDNARVAECVPWLVIEPDVTESELKHLMQYLFGSVNTEYGKIRLDQGVAGRYSDFFDEIFIEFTGAKEQIIGDVARGAFVNWAIEVISGTPEYKTVRNQIVFIDGMTYREGVLLSDADYHCSDFTLPAKVYDDYDPDEIIESLKQPIPRDPGRGLSYRPEIVRSYKIPDNYNLAQAAAPMFAGLGEDFAAFMIEQPEITGPETTTRAVQQTLVRIGREVAGLNRLNVIRSRTTEAGLVPTETDEINCYAFSDRDKSVYIIVNTSDTAQACSLVDADLTGAEYTMFDHAGVQFDSYSRERGVLSVLPGGILLIEKGPGS